MKRTRSLLVVLLGRTASEVPYAVARMATVEPSEKSVVVIFVSGTGLRVVASIMLSMIACGGG